MNNQIENIIELGQKFLTIQADTKANTNERNKIKESLGKSLVIACLNADNKTLKTLNDLFTKDSALYDARQIKTFADVITGNLYRKQSFAYIKGRGTKAEKITVTLDNAMKGIFPDNFVLSTAYKALSQDNEGQEESNREKAIFQKLVSDNPKALQGIKKLTIEGVKEAMTESEFSALWTQAENSFDLSQMQEQAESLGESVFEGFKNLLTIDKTEAINLLMQMQEVASEEEKPAKKTA